jgi:uncharacterized protein
MVVGTLKIMFVLRGAHSLKEKRRVLSSLKARVFNKFKVSVAEVDHQDVWQRATLGVAMVGTEGGYVNEVLSKVVDAVRFVPEAELVDYELEMFR